MAIGRPLNRDRKSSSVTESQAMALVSDGGIEPLYSADHPACCSVQLVVQARQVRTWPFCLHARREQRQVELREVDQFGAGVLSRSGLHEAFRQLEVLAIARCQNDEIRGHGDDGS